MRPRLWVPEAPQLLLNRRRELFMPGLKTTIEGWFEVELVHKRTGLVTFHSRFKNLITDAGLDAAGQNTLASLIVYCGVGTGSTVPTAADVALVAEVHRTSSTGGFGTTSGVDTTTWYAWRKITRTFTTAQANNNLTEIGIFQNSSGAPMWSRSLIKDGAGNPTSITKTSDFELRVTYEWRVYPEGGTADVVYSAPVNGVAENITVRPAQSGDMTAGGTLYADAGLGYWMAHTGTLGLRSAKPGGSNYPASTVVNAAYGSGDFYRDTTATWNASNAVDSIRSFHNGRQTLGVTQTQCMESQHQMTSTIVKTNTQKMDLVLRASWARRP